MFGQWTLTKLQVWNILVDGLFFIHYKLGYLCLACVLFFVSVFFSLSLPFSFFLCLCLFSFFLCLCLFSFFLFLSLSLSLPFFFLSLSLSMPFFFLSLSLSVSAFFLSLSLSAFFLSFSLCLSFSLSLSLSPDWIIKKLLRFLRLLDFFLFYIGRFLRIFTHLFVRWC